MLTDVIVNGVRRYQFWIKTSTNGCEYISLETLKKAVGFSFRFIHFFSFFYSFFEEYSQRERKLERKI